MSITVIKSPNTERTSQHIDPLEAVMGELGLRCPPALTHPGLESLPKLHYHKKPIAWCF